MDFFESQDYARRRTSLLVFYYFLALILITVSVYAVFTAIFVYYGQSENGVTGYVLWDPALFVVVAGITLLVVGLASIYKVKQLSGGGKSVADLLGGRVVEQDTKNPSERKFLNIVEEMSIASGVQVPRAYILENEKGINAFAAGFSQGDAVIGVTRGCLENLSRDELQGVIAHEFSHILNGDMRLNIKLMGVLYGIFVIAFIGYMILRSSMFTSRSRSRSGRGDGRVPIAIFGLALTAIGYIGVFFGNLIKSAVSRQREYLADASSVQFTRNPSGISGALKKIAGVKEGSKIENKHAPEASHLFFSSNFSGAMQRLMSTHPPIQERIKRLDPSFAGAASGLAGKAEHSTVAGIAGPPGGKLAISPGDVTSSIGNVQPLHLEYASRIRKGIPPELIKAAHNTGGAQAVVYALLLSKEDAVREKQLSILREKSEKKVFAYVREMSAKAAALEVEYRLPLLDIAVSALKNIARDAYTVFRDNIGMMVEADGKISLFEYTVQSMVLRHVESSFSAPAPPRVDFHKLKELNYQCRLLLSLLAHYGIDDSSKKEAAFLEAGKKLDITDAADFIPFRDCSFEKLDGALKELDRAAPGVKKKIIDAAVSCVAADGFITAGQAELIRVTGDAIGCPVPPLFPGKR